MSQDCCKDCLYEVPLECANCPHCGGRNGLFPNVRRASGDPELQALFDRYEHALVDAGKRGDADRVREFETAVSGSKAVLACELSKLHAIVDRPGRFANYYDLMSLQFLPKPDAGQPDWNTLRPHAELELLGSHNNIDQLHYACLTLNDESLPHYGECTILLRGHGAR